MDRREPFFSNTKWLKGAAFLLMFVLLLSKVENSNSVVAKPESFRVLQPDGNFLNMILKGDAFCNWLEDDKGNVIVRSGEEFYYANGKRENGKLAPSEFKVGHQDPQSLGLNKDLRPEGKKQKLDKMRKKLNIDSKSEANSGHEGRRLSTLITTGSLKNLVIPVMFNDHQDRDLPSKEDIAVLWNAPNGHPTYYDSTNMSIRDFYLENSYGLLDINSTVLDWVLVSENEAYYGAGESGGATQLMELLNEVLDYVDDLVDFSEFDENGDGYIDAIAFVHSGYGAEYGGTDVDGQDYEDRIWSHKWSLINTTIWWYDPFVSDESVMVLNYHMETILDGVSGSQISTIAVGAHETGHFLGLPDLYDTDYSSTGIGSWGVMANSWGWDSSGRYPPSFCAWSKYTLGWTNPLNITQPGTYELENAEQHDAAFIISKPYSAGEYLLIENRQPILSDLQIPRGGLLIWHIDDYALSENNLEGYHGQTSWPEDGAHYQVALLQADGLFELEQGFGADLGDLFYNSSHILYNSYNVHPSSFGYQNGELTPAGFEIHNVSSKDGVLTFTVVNDTSFHYNDSSFVCNELLYVQMYDTWGDGWQGTVFELYKQPDFEVMQEVTLSSGSYGEECLNVKANKCYYFAQATLGTWPSELYWQICNFTGSYEDDLSFCLDADGVCYQADLCEGYLVLNMYDAYGDGWNGASYDLYEVGSNTSIQTVSLESGSTDLTCLLVNASTCYMFVESDEGSFPSEIYWELCGMTGYSGTDLEICIDSQGECYIPGTNCTSGSELTMYDSWGDGWTGTEFALFLDLEPISYHSLLYGSNQSVCLSTDNEECYWFGPVDYGSWTNEVFYELCGYFGDYNSWLYFCVDDDYSCAPANACPDGITVLMFDTFADGWNGAVFSLTPLNGNQSVQNVTLSSGGFNVSCLDAIEDQCYLFELATPGSWPQEISWNICGASGTYQDSQRVCVDSNGTCYTPECFELEMYDSWNDGWDYTVFTLYNNGGEEIQDVTLQNGGYGMDCLEVNHTECYIFYISEVGWYVNEIAYALCGVIGYYDTAVSFCVAENGTCVDVSVLTVSFSDTSSSSDILDSISSDSMNNSSDYTDSVSEDEVSSAAIPGLGQLVLLVCAIYGIYASLS
mmetsp:Transcript_9334/g.12215  ORF Transcript_9334/g.12215 Transcript_9334/m.12215 type:complete len:1132 (+) Transcript_9334:1503-4898(+)|eukprot:CAMPEP_0117832686 /NCGR_PEP_ID=MMETSP0949-20121206/9888_1 /TAXON_ID=44440 /ORGANISM="Chattonella subsalsa, Strain CCMP2191" /LENGTH=1131 /DNA_ID=CAMNT_0005674233 /DNA_START=159 /DNA_END=3554 /DNA_ORIENTATION=+